MNQERESKGSFLGEHGLSIFYRKIAAPNEKAQLVIAHGLGEHSGRYQNIFQLLIPSGVSIWALDLCGHGQSEGKRGHVTTFLQYILDLKKLVALSKDLKPEHIKTYLLGHSMGGLIVLTFAQHYPEMIDGVIASSPALGMKVEVPRIKEMMGKLMSFVWPSLTMGNELDASKISHDEHVVRAYVEDALVHDRVSARWFTAYLSAMNAVHQSIARIRAPVLMQIAGDDHLVDAATSKAFFEKISVDDKTLYVYDRLYHEIYNETIEQRETVLLDLKQWLNSHINI